MDEQLPRATSAARPPWPLPALTALAAVSAAASTLVYWRAAADGFFGDDLALIGEALRGASLWEPISAHVRPLVRLHFRLVAQWPSPALFHLVSWVLHVATAGATALFVRALGLARAAPLAGLLVLAVFLANEALFWVAAVGVLHAALFSFLSLWLERRDRPWAAFGCLALASLAYELWIVVPAVMLVERRPWRRMLPSLALLAVHAVLFVWLAGGRVGAYGGLSLVDLPRRFSQYAFGLVSPLAGSLPTWLAVLIMLGLLALGLARRWRVPVVLYAVSATLFAFSEHTASRFAYVPALALVLMLVVSLEAREARRAGRAAAALVIGWLAVISPVINHLDRVDYGRLSAMHEELLTRLRPPLSSSTEGASVVLVNREGPERLVALSQRWLGRPKPLLVRSQAVGGLVYLQDLAAVLLAERGLAPSPAECAGTVIEIGHGPVLDRACFRVVPARTGHRGTPPRARPRRPGS